MRIISFGFVFLFTHLLFASELTLTPQWPVVNSMVTKEAGVKLFSADPSDPDEGENYCSVLFPGEGDDLNRYCINRGWFAVTYDGLILDAICFSSYEKALEKMVGSRACGIKPPVEVGYCRVMNPGELDEVNRGCGNLNKYAVSYDGFALDGLCFDTFEQAMKKAESTEACQIEPPVSYGECSILYPGLSDQSGRRCRNINQYTILRDGYILKDRCYSSLDRAIRVMQETRICR